jgi:hypothetical protein
MPDRRLLVRYGAIARRVDALLGMQAPDFAGLPEAQAVALERLLADAVEALAPLVASMPEATPAGLAAQLEAMQREFAALGLPDPANAG